MVMISEKLIKKRPAAAYKERLKMAKEALKGLGETKVIQLVAETSPELDTLANALRWQRAWTLRQADVEITEAVEKIVLQLGKKKPSKKLVRQGLTN